MNMAVQITKTKAEEDLAAQFEASKESLPNNEEVMEMRIEAIELFKELGLPHRRIEEWKYSDLRRHLSEAFKSAPSDEKPLSDGELQSVLGALDRLDCHLMVFVNGTHHLSRLDGNIKADALTLSEAIKDRPEWFAGELGCVNTPEKDSVFALNTAFMTDGAAIRVHDVEGNGSPEKPLHLVFITRGNEQRSIATRNLISIGKGVQVTLIEHHIALGEKAFQTNAATEMVVGDGASVNHFKLQRENAETTHLSTWTIRLGQDASYDAVQFSKNSIFTRNQIYLRFDGEGTIANISGASMLRGSQHGDTTLLVDHAVPNCKSRELYKAVLDDSAKGVFQAKVAVRPDAQKTDGEQMSQALLLSDTAEFDAKPELEIFADDVICGHGATSGQIDEELMFYLRARGLPEEEARALLIRAFVGEIFEMIETEEIREAFVQEASEWLNGS